MARQLRLLLLASALVALALPASALAAPIDFAGVWSTSFYNTRVDPLGAGFEGRNQLDATDLVCRYVGQQAIWQISGAAPESFGKVIYPYRSADGSSCDNTEVNAWFWVPPGGSGRVLRVCVPDTPDSDSDAPAPVDRTSTIGNSTSCTDHSRVATRAQLNAQRTKFTYVPSLKRGKCHRSGYLTYYVAIRLGRSAVPADPIDAVRIFANGHRVKAFSTINRPRESLISFGNFTKTHSVFVRVVIETARGKTIVRPRLFARCYHP